jgi:hypothetical protein
MHSIRSTIVSTTLSVLLLAGNASAASRPQIDDATAKLAAAASPMKAMALEKLYAGRTWKWKTGGGFFSADRNQFAAVSREGAAWSYGEGRWYATNGGKLLAGSVVQQDGGKRCRHMFPASRKGRRHLSKA